MTNNPSIMDELQTENIASTLNKTYRTVDLNFKGYSSQRKTSKYVLSGVQADINRVAFWLSSKRDDYVRSNLKGGVIYDMIGTLGNGENLDYWKSELTRRFNSEFNGEMVLIYLNLSMVKKRRALSIEMIVQDRFRGITFPINTEAKI